MRGRPYTARGSAALWGRYFACCAKKIGKRLPAALLSAALLTVALLLALSALLREEAGREDRQKFPVAVVQEGSGTSGMDGALSMGIALLQATDESRFTLTVKEMGEEEAKKALSRGELAGCFLFPEGFADAAARGEIRSIRAIFPASVGSTGSTGSRSGALAALLQKEFTEMVSEVLSAAEKSAYGAAAVATRVGGDGGKAMDGMALGCAGLLLRRGDLYTVEEIGVSEERLSAAGTMGLSFLSLFLLLAALPFASVCARRETALHRRLAASGVGEGKQLLSLFAALVPALLLLGLLFALPFGLLAAGGDASGAESLAESVFPGLREALAPFFRGSGDLSLGSGTAVFRCLLALLPAAAFAAAFSLLLFTLAGEGAGGVLLHFFAVLGLGYFSGCFYPLSAFPPAMREGARLLPPALLREWVAAALRGASGEGFSAAWRMLLLGALCLTLSFALLRRRR